MNVTILRSGRVLEFQNFKQKSFLIYLLKRFGAWLIDLIIVIGIVYGVTIFITNPMTKYVLGSIFGIIFASVYYTLSITLLSGQTIGYRITMLVLVRKDAEPTIFINKITKSILMSVYYLPFFGVAMLLTSIIMIPITKGVSIIDLWSKTAVITTTLFNEISKEKERVENE